MLYLPFDWIAIQCEVGERHKSAELRDAAGAELIVAEVQVLDQTGQRLKMGETGGKEFVQRESKVTCERMG